METNWIGINKEGAKDLAQELNILLANYQMFYQNLRGFHWNIKGDKFFELHTKFEEYYNDAQLKIDEIAERVLTLKERPFHTFESYLKNANIEAVKDVSDGRIAMSHILESFKKLLKIERRILELSQEYNDEGTNSMISGFIIEQEKTVWMLGSWLG